MENIMNVLFRTSLVLLFITCSTILHAQNKRLAELFAQMDQQLLNADHLAATATANEIVELRIKPKSQVEWALLQGRLAIGNLYSRQGLQYFQEALVQLEIQKNNLPLKIEALYYTGLAYQQLSLLDSAKWYLRESIRNNPKASEHDFELLNNQYHLLGKIAATQQEFALAQRYIDTMNQYTSVAFSEEDFRSLRPLMTKAFIEYYQLHAAEAVSLGDSILSVLSKQPQAYTGWLMEALLYQGYSSYYTGDYAAERSYYEQLYALQQIRNLEHGLAPTTIMIELGYNYANGGKVREGLALLLDAENRQQLAGWDNLGFATTLGRLSDVYLNIGNNTKALSYSRQAYALYEKHLQAGHRNLAIVKYNQANCYYNLGQYPQALSTYQEVWGAMEDRDDVATSMKLWFLQGLARVSTAMHDFGQARYYTYKALDLLPQVYEQPHPEYGKLLLELAYLCESEEDWAAAAAYFNENLYHCNVSIDSPTKAKQIHSSYRGLSRMHQAMMRLDSAEYYVHTALEYAKTHLDSSDSDLFLSNQQLANIHLAQGAYTKAIPLFEDLLDTTRVRFGTTSSQYLKALLGWGAAQQALGQYDLLLNRFGSYDYRAVEDIEASTLLSEYLLVLAESEQALNRLEQAMHHYTACLERLGQLPAQLDQREARRHSLLRQRKIVDRLLGNAWFKKQASIQHWEMLFQQLDYLKHDQLVTDTKFARRLRNNQSISYEELQFRDSLKTELLFVEESLNTQYLPEQDVNGWKLIGQALRNKINEVEAQWQERVEIGDNLKQSGALLLDEVQRQLRADQTLLSYLIGDEELHIFVVRSDFINCTSVPLPSNWEGLVQKMVADGIRASFGSKVERRLSEQAADLNLAESAFDLYNLLIAPIEHLASTALVVVPDGIIADIPFGALLTNGIDQHLIGSFAAYPFLIKRYAISYCYSTRLLLQQVENPEEHAMVKVLGVAPFTDLGPRLLTKTDRTRRTPASKNSLVPQLSSLSFTASELRAIEAVWDTHILSGDSATYLEVLRAAQNAEVLHFATHAMANKLLGDFSYLALSSDAHTYQPLYAREIYTLNLPAKMIVLSACETGGGEQRKGEGVISLGRSFIAAGASSVFVTLWPLLDDASSVHIVEKFYAALYEEDYKDIALQQAKVHYLKTQPGYLQHPFYWAAFVGYGHMKGLRK